MFIRFFRSNQPATLFAIPLVALVFWLPAFFKPALDLSVHPMLFYKFIDSFLDTFPHWLSISTCIVLISAEAMLLNYFLNEYEVLQKKSYLPALFFILFTSASPGQLQPHASLFAGLLLIIITGRIFSLYKNDRSIPLAFDIAMLIGFSTLVYLPSVIFFLILFLGLIILRPFIWREWLVPFIGFILPFVFVWVYFFWNDRTDEFAQFFFVPEKSVGIVNLIQQAGWKLAFPAIAMFIGLLSLNKMAAHFFKSIIRTRLYQQLLLTTIPLLLIPAFFSGVSYRELILPVSIPLSVVFSSLFLFGKRMFWLETLFIMLLASVLLLHFLRA